MRRNDPPGAAPRGLILLRDGRRGLILLRDGRRGLILLREHARKLALLRRNRALILMAVQAGLLLLLTACQDDQGLMGPGLENAIGPSTAFGIWTPGPGDTCSKEIHDRYAVVGPDGLIYPTWHPPVDPGTGCHFGHEHGRDPRGSALYAVTGDLPFGYANQQQDIHNPNMRRHEDHVGHKIEWENGMQMNVRGAAGAIISVSCDVLTKLHQGTHSKDAFTNNVHELIYHLRCSDGSRLHMTVLTPIGRPGEMVTSCDRRTIQVGPATPVNSPNGNGRRILPDRQCVEQHLLVHEGSKSNFGQGLHESWETHTTLRRADGHTLALVDAYFQVNFPSRFYDPSMPDGVGRPLELCVTPFNGRQARGGPCDALNGLQGVRFDSPSSPFNGAKRFVDINANRINNASGPDVWYTDPFGRNGRTEPFPGSIRQVIAKVDNTGLNLHGPVIGKSRDYGGPGVRAPN